MHEERVSLCSLGTRERLRLRVLEDSLSGDDEALLYTEQQIDSTLDSCDKYKINTQLAQREKKKSIYIVQVQSPPCSRNT